MATVSATAQARFAAALRDLARGQELQRQIAAREASDMLASLSP